MPNPAKAAYRPVRTVVDHHEAYELWEDDARAASMVDIGSLNRTCITCGCIGGVIGSSLLLGFILCFT